MEESVSSSAGESTAQLDLTQPPMFRSLSDVFGNVVPRELTGIGENEWPNLLQRADSGVETDKALQAVATILQYLEKSSAVTLVAATKVLADGSRYESLRLPFGDNNVLGFYLDLVAKDADEHDWTSDALRLVGNTCADLDVNRERALAKLKLPALLRRLTEEGKADIALGVLCNLCLDYEPAQVALRANQLFFSIVRLLECRCYNLDFLPQVSLLLDTALEDFNAEMYSGSHAIAVIYQTITIPGVDIETQVSLADAIIALLGYEHIQKSLIADNDLLIILDLFVFSYTQDAISPKYHSASTSIPKLDHRSQGPEDQAQLTALRSALSAKLWDMSALTEFAVKYQPASELVERLISWLSTDEPQMQLCACSILRNVASSDQNATDMVMTLKVHRLLIPLLRDSSNLQVLEEVTRLMKNLAVPAANKKELEAFESVTSLWSRFESPTLHYAAAGLVRQLLRGCFGNVDRFLRPSNSAKNTSYASRFLQLYSNTNDSAIKTEVARTVVEIWRTANSGNSEETRAQVFCVEKALREGNMSPDVMIKPVVAMLVKSENASLVTEGWFGLALMAGSEQLREAIYNALCGDDATKDVFKATISSEDAHSKDRDNAQILTDRLLKGIGLTPEGSSPYAYVFYATEAEYACSVLINIDRLKNIFHTTHPIIVLVKPTISSEYFSRFTAQNAMVIPHEPPPLHDKDSPYYTDVLLKLVGFRLHQYIPSLKRVLILDSDQMILQSLDHVFSLPAADLAAPRAYGQGTFGFTSAFLLVSLSDRLWDRIDRALQTISDNTLDMDLLNRMFGETAMLLPGDYCTLNSHWETNTIPTWWQGSEPPRDPLWKPSRKLRPTPDPPPIEVPPSLRTPLSTNQTNNLSATDLDLLTRYRELTAARETKIQAARDAVEAAHKKQVQKDELKERGIRLRAVLEDVHNNVKVMHYTAFAKPWRKYVEEVKKARPDAHPLFAEGFELWRTKAAQICPWGGKEYVV